MIRRKLVLVLGALALMLSLAPAAMAADEATVSSVRLDRRAQLFGDGALISGIVTCNSHGVVAGMEIAVQQRVRGGTVEGFISLSGGNVTFDDGSDVCSVGTHRFEMALENHSEFAFRAGVATVVFCEVGGVDCATTETIRLTRERTVTRSSLVGAARGLFRAAAR